jgi:hypothetical protein
MLQEQKKYIIRETVLNSIVNGIFSVFFVWLIFSGHEVIELWGESGLATDFVPQTFLVSVMSMLVLGGVTRKRVLRGSILPLENYKSRLSGNILVRSLFVATVVTVVAAPVAIFLLAIAWNDSIDLVNIYFIKGFYGFFIAMAVSPIALRTALSDQCH